MVRSGGWNVSPALLPHRLVGRTLGLLGYGGIARSLHRKVGGFGFGRVLVCDPFVQPKLIEAQGAVPVDLAGLLAQSDYLSVHVPLSPQTRHLIGAEQLAGLKSGAILINTSRGSLVDEAALIDALRTGRLAGAGLDVFEEEPLPVGSPLRTLDNVILTDHTGWYSEESVAELKTKAAKNVAAVLAGGPPIYPVNTL
jgi:D-3-phosphoglycerate dehydrogenase